MKRILMAQVTALACVASLTGCGDLVVKVQKKPKDMDLKSLNDSGDGSANLNGADNFLKHLDDLKVVAADLLIKQMAKKDYRGEFRSAVRNYRTFLIERSSKQITGGEAFYSSADECRKTGLSLNMDKANDFLGMILKTAVLAKIGEVSAQNLNPGLSKEIAAVSQLIMLELGVKIEGEASVDKESDSTTSKAKVKISLTPIDGEMIGNTLVSAEQKANDAAEVLTLDFTRALGEDSVGTFTAKITLGHKVGESIETVVGTLNIDRKKTDSRFVHTAIISVGKEGTAASYARAMTFEQVDGKKHQVKITDSLNYGSESEQSFATIMDVEKGTQCKLTLDGVKASPVVPSVPPNIGDESGFLPVDTDDDKPVATATPASPVTPAMPVDPSKPVNPGSTNPGQSPGQSPSQSAGQKTMI